MLEVSLAELVPLLHHGGGVNLLVFGEHLQDAPVLLGRVPLVARDNVPSYDVLLDNEDFYHGLEVIHRLIVLLRSGLVLIE